MEAETQAEAPFGAWLMRKLKERGMSLSDVARLAQCDYTYLWRLVNVGRARGRQYRRPSYDMAERVGKALGATHEALTAAGYLPAENVRNSRVVDALDRVERQLAQLREELNHSLEEIDSPSAESESRALPLLESDAWPADPDAAPRRIELPAWLAGEASWAVQVGPEAGFELHQGDLALIQRGPAIAGQLTVIARNGRLEFASDTRGDHAIGAVIAFVRRFSR